MSKETIKYTPKETINLMKEIITANDTLLNQGKLPVSISIEGSHGIGKSTICKEVAEDMGKGFFKLNLAQLTEPSELIGYYSKEYKVTKPVKIVTSSGTEEKVSEEWITETLLSKYVHDGYTLTTEVRTRPCPPEWVVNLQENSILCLDDYTRSNSLFSQAVMELVNTNEMLGWNLKGKKIQIILNENPDTGEYNVSSTDLAQADRVLKIHMVWNAGDWAERAEKIKTDERLINFVLSMSELFEAKKQDGISASGNVSPRMMDKFFNLISTIDDFEKNLDKIILFGSVSVGKEVTNHLVNFINKRLDKLPSIDDLIKKWDLPVAKSQLTMACGDFVNDPENAKQATAAILATRLFNYAKHRNKEFTTDNIKQYLELILHSSFSVDQKYQMGVNVMQCGPKFPAIIAGDPRFAKALV